MAQITTMKFSPKSGFNRNDWKTDMIGNYHAAAALEWGLVVDADADGVLTAATDTYGVGFTMEESTADGPPELDIYLGIFHQYEVKVGRPVSVAIPKDDAQVYTIHVSKGSGEADLAKGQFVKIAAGKYVTDATLTASTAKGKIVELPADTGRTGLFVVQIMNV
ncbi:MAG: hypothetical protein Q8910_00365 [Bacteroidota bacterium]|nr:hypothetical protein [Bacteroidota bacterium]